MLDAIGASDGSRSDVISKMFATDVQNGLLGSFKFSANGDPTAASGAVVAITVYKATDKLVTDKVISPKQSHGRRSARPVRTNGVGVRLGLTPTTAGEREGIALPPRISG